MAVADTTPPAPLPSTEWPADLPPCFHMVLSPLSGTSPRGRAVLLHGWHQSHSAWLRTACNLRDELRLEVLLIDFYNHGQSPTLRDRRLHCAETLCRQVRALVLYLGWQSSTIALGGCSMGGGVALHYFARWPSTVRKLVLVASAGLDEPFWVSSTIGGTIARAFFGKPPKDFPIPTNEQVSPGVVVESTACIPATSPNEHTTNNAAAEETVAGIFATAPTSAAVGSMTAEQEDEEVCEDTAASAKSEAAICSPSLAHAPPPASLLAAALARFSFITTTPRYRVPKDIVHRLTEARIGVTLCSGGLDLIHRSNHDKWSKIPGIRILHRHWWDHTLICTRIDSFQLWLHPEIWIEQDAFLVSKL
eukprot:TRINITY_DN56430_c0_g1_i1.p1 TRINITY_DN56430_c0_g1~~TRINITY_DN56430_c0_g1_i1.p1  ORF type:complete len:391 (+),score=49.84 TRINITY_DN56430_c0_g1_i1:85-1173(+)